MKKRMVNSSSKAHAGITDPNLPNVELAASHGIGIERFLELQQQKSECNAQIKQIESEMKRLQGRIIAEMAKDVPPLVREVGIPMPYPTSRIVSPVSEKKPWLDWKHSTRISIGNMFLCRKTESSV